jgi:plastocyanin
LKQTAVVFAAALLAACGGTNPNPKAAETKKGLVEVKKAVEYFHPDPANAAKVHGEVVFKGTKPKRTPIAMNVEAACVKAHSGHPVYDEPVITGKGGMLASAMVYIKTGLEDKHFEPPQAKVALDQHGCMFVPRVIGIQVGQVMDVKNSDPVSHNIHPLAKENREWSQQQSPDSPDLEHKFARQEVMIPVKCDVHKWMRAFVGVLPHPYFMVTGADGAFELPNLPPGDYTLAVWHEKLGEKSQQIHVGPSSDVAVSFTYE